MVWGISWGFGLLHDLQTRSCPCRKLLGEHGMTQRPFGSSHASSSHGRKIGTAGLSLRIQQRSKGLEAPNSKNLWVKHEILWVQIDYMQDLSLRNNCNVMVALKLQLA
eukprot:4812923-Amphidinium_carterae.1